MTAAELAVLRDKVTRARLDRAPARQPTPRELAGAAALRAMKLAGKCVYCGDRATSRNLPRTCRAHRDLPALDPNYEGGVA